MGPLLMFVAAPWLAVLIFSEGGLNSAVVTAVVGIALFGLGRLPVQLLIPSLRLTADIHLLCLPLGFIFAAGALQIAAYLDFSIRVTAIVLGVCGICGSAMVICRKDVWGSKTIQVPFGWLYVAASIAVAFIYFLPAASHNSVPTDDGGFQWIYVDAPYHQAIAAQLANENHPLRCPGFSEQPMKYHMGRHAVAGAISSVFGTSIGDALTRITMALSLCSLMLATIGLARIATVQLDGKDLAGIAGIAIFFFLPGLPTLLVNEMDSSARKPQAFFWRLMELEPDIRMTNWDRYLAHLYIDGSCTTALVLLMTVAALLSIETTKAGHLRLEYFTMVVASLGVCLNGVAAIAAAMLVVGIVLTEGWRNIRSYLFVLATTATFVTSMAAAGFFATSPPDSVGVQTWIGTVSTLSNVQPVLLRLSWVALGALMLLVSPRILSLLWFDQARHRCRRVLFLLTTSLLSLFVLVGFQGYPVFFLGPLLSVYAGAGFSTLWSVSQIPDGTNPGKAHFTLAKFYQYAICFLICGLVGGAISVGLSFSEDKLNSSPFSTRTLTYMALVTATTTLLLMGCICRRFAISQLRAAFVQHVFLLLLLVGGMLGFARHSYIYAWDALGRKLSTDAACVESLTAIRRVLPIDAVVASTHHSISTLKLNARSYSYSAITERQLFLEGWQYSGANAELIRKIKSDNELLFNTQDPKCAKEIVNRYGITHLLVEPGQRLGMCGVGVPWLRQIPIAGCLSLYAVDDFTSNEDDGR